MYLYELDPDKNKVCINFERIPIIRAINNPYQKANLKLFLDEWDLLAKNEIWKPEYCDWMVTHSIQHIYGVFILANRFYMDQEVKKNEKKPHLEFSPNELFYLILSIWLHDIGMYRNVYWPNSDQLQEINIFLKAYEIAPIEKIDAAKQDLWVRKHHSLLAAYMIEKYSWKLKTLDTIARENRAKEILAKICLYHSSKTRLRDQDKISGECLFSITASQLASYYSDIDFLKLCAVLRFLDGCDQTNRRKRFIALKDQYQSNEAKLDEINEFVASLISDSNLRKEWKDLEIKDTERIKLMCEKVLTSLRDSSQIDTIKSKLDDFESILKSPEHYDYKEAISDIYFKEGKIIILPSDKIGYYESYIQRVIKGDIEKELENYKDILLYSIDDIIVEHPKVTGRDLRSREFLDYALPEPELDENILKRVENLQDLASAVGAFPFIKKPLTFDTIGDRTVAFLRWINKVEKLYSTTEIQQQIGIDKFLADASKKVLFITGKHKGGKRTFVLYYIFKGISSSNKLSELLNAGWKIYFLSPSKNNIEKIDEGNTKSLNNAIFIIDTIWRNGESEELLIEKTRKLLNFMIGGNRKCIITSSFESDFYIREITHLNQAVCQTIYFGWHKIIKDLERSPNLVFDIIKKYYFENDILNTIIILAELGKQGYGVTSIAIDEFLKYISGKQSPDKNIKTRISLFLKTYCISEETDQVVEYKLKEDWVNAICGIKNSFYQQRIDQNKDLAEQIIKIQDGLRAKIDNFIHSIKQSNLIDKTVEDNLLILADIAKMSDVGFGYCEENIKSISSQKIKKYFLKTLNQISFFKGEIKKKNKDYDGAIDCYQKARSYILEYSSESQVSRYIWKIADCYAYKGNLTKSIENYENALNVEIEEKRKAQETAGRAYGNFFKKLRDLRDLRQEWQANEKIFEKWEEYGKQAIKIDEIEDKEILFKNSPQDYIRYLKNFGDLAEVYLLRAEEMYQKAEQEDERKKQYMLAIDVINSAIKKCRQYVDQGKIDVYERMGSNYYHGQLSQIYRKLGENEKARDEAISAAREERKLKGWLEATKTLILLEKIDEAKKALETAKNIAEDPKEGARKEEIFLYEYLNGKIKYCENEIDEAIKIFESLLHNFLNWYNEAISSDRECLEGDRPGDICYYMDQLYYALGKCYQDKGNYIKSLECYEKFLVLIGLSLTMTRSEIAHKYYDMGDLFMSWAEMIYKRENRFSSIKRFLEAVRLCYSEAQRKQAWKYEYYEARSKANYLLGRLEEAEVDKRVSENIKTTRGLKFYERISLNKINSAQKNKEILGDWLYSIIESASLIENNTDDKIRTILYGFRESLRTNKNVLSLWFCDTEDINDEQIEENFRYVFNSFSKMIRALSMQDIQYRIRILVNQERFFNNRGICVSPQMEIINEIFKVYVKMLLKKYSADKKLDNIALDNKNIAKDWSRLGNLIHKFNEEMRFKVPWKVGIACLTIATKLNKENLYAHYHLGWQLIYSGNLPEARDEFYQIAVLGKKGYREFPKAWPGLAKTYEREGKLDEAANCYEACTRAILEMEGKIYKKIRNTTEYVLWDEHDKYYIEANIWGDMKQDEFNMKNWIKRNKRVASIRDYAENKISKEDLIIKLNVEANQICEEIARSTKDGCNNIEKLCFLLSESENDKRINYLSIAKKYYEESFEYLSSEEEKFIINERLAIIDKQIRRIKQIIELSSN